MTHLLLVAFLAQAPDAPLRPPELVDEHGSVTTITGVEPLAPGTVCLTHAKAQSVRDDLVAKNARLEVLEAGSGIDWPLVLAVAGLGVLAAGVAAAGGYLAGQASVRR